MFLLTIVLYERYFMKNNMQRNHSMKITYNLMYMSMCVNGDFHNIRIMYIFELIISLLNSLGVGSLTFLVICLSIVASLKQV